jgi:chromosome segregation ATPase
MNASLSDGNEPVIDIFILSANSPLSTQLEKQLGDEGYSVTLFSDGSHLLETLRNGKPNLLMCDTTVSDADAFEVCRQIKADEYLWNIPLLIITGASDLGDLLRVLDCNADNFIAHPFDPPYLLSLIEGMLTVPVERQTPEQIKTQFKIKHDDRVFVVTADRRKLLEFLLSSFEIAVNKSTDLSRAQEDSRNLGFTIRKLEENVHENTKVIGIINETLKTKEQKLAELTGQLSDREQTVREKIAAVDELSRDLSTEKSAHAEAQNEIQRLEKEKDESRAAHQASIDQLQRQVSDQSSELATLRPAFERANEELARVSSQRKETESELSTTAAQKEQAEKSLLSLTTEYEQLKINFGTEKNRAQEAEQELNAVLLAKTQSEQDLTGIINDLKSTAKAQAAALTRLREESESERARLQEELESERARFTKELESERARLLHTEENLNTVTAEKKLSEASLQATIDAGKKDLLDLQARLDTAGSRLEEKEQAIKTLNDEIATVRSARESAEQELAFVSRALGETNTAFDGKQKDLLDLQARLDTTRPLLEEAEQAIKTLNDEIATVRSARESAEQELASVSHALAETNTALEAETRNSASHKEDLAKVYTEKEKAEAVAESLSGSLKELQDQLEQEKSRYRDNEERMNVILLQRDRELGDLRQVHEDTRTAVSSHTTSLEQMKRELASAVSARTEIEEKLHLAEAKIRQIGKELESASDGREKEKQQRTSLTDELERVKTNLEQETVRRQESEDQLREALSRQQQQEQELERFESETKTLHADLSAERRMHEAAKEQNQSLEEQVTALGREKLEAEQAAAGLTAEIDQARVALADEWEDHMTDHEQLEAGAGKKLQSGPVPSSGMRKEAEIIKKRSLIVKVPNMPSEIRPLPRSMVAIDPVKASEPESPHIKSVEDLFEDDEDDGDKTGGAPVVSIIQEPATEPVQDVLPDAMPGRSAHQESFFEDEGSSAPESPDTREDVSGFDDDENIPPVTANATPIARQDVAFNREQWLDLLKWSHHCEGLTQDQRMQIVHMGRLIQKGRKLTNKQEEQVLEMIALVQRLGYRIP